MNTLFHIVDGHVRLPEAVHSLPNLLDLSAEEVLDSFRRSQAEDFVRLIAEVETPDSPLFRLFDDLRSRVPAGNPFHRTALFRPGALRDLFFELHDHVMSHPVWRHPFFLRVFAGRFDRAQATTFAVHYFNQIKNTRQCVALAAGRFHGLMGLPFGPLNERLSEMTQIMMAQLVADEYGVGSHELADYPPLERLLRTRTHIGIYRQLFTALDVPLAAQDVPMLPGVADNVLTQRLLAGSPAFTPLEALASVGLGMEWGVPEFFSLLLGGMVRFAAANDLPFTPHQMEVFIAHVRYDVLHAVAVMLATALHMHDESDVGVVKDACSTLMASRYGMMTDLYDHVFGESCPSLAEAGLAPRYHLRDRRIAEELAKARRAVPAGAVLSVRDYGSRSELPFVFAV